MKIELNLYEQIVSLWRSRTTVKALFVLVVSLNSVLFTITSVVFRVFDKYKIIEGVDGFLAFLIQAAGIFGVANLLLLVFWSYWRRVPTINPPQLGVFFCPHAEPACKDLVHSLYDQFKKDLRDRSLSSIVSHSLLPENVSITGMEDARDLLAKSNARLIVYGSLQRGKIQGTLTEGFKTVSFTIRHRNLAEHEILPIADSMASFLANRSFVSREDNSFFEQHVVAENLGEVACFFIALALNLDGQYNDAAQILEVLRESLGSKRKAQPTNPHIQRFYDQVIEDLISCLAQQFTEEYDHHVVENISDHTVSEHVTKCSTILDRIQQLSPSPDEHDLVRAILHFHAGDLLAARACVSRASKSLPRSDVGPHLSFAFLNLWEEKYPAALRAYRRASGCTRIHPRVIMSVIQFLGGLVSKHPEKPQLRYGLAYVNESFFDSKRAIEEYERFLEESRDANSKGLSLLRNDATQRLATLREVAE